jgi:hypothetical protein
MLVLHMPLPLAIFGRSNRLLMEKHGRSLHGTGEIGVFNRNRLGLATPYIVPIGAGHTSTYTIPVVLDSNPVQLCSGVYPCRGHSISYTPMLCVCVDMAIMWPRSDGCRATLIISMVAPLTAIYFCGSTHVEFTN